MIAILEDEMVNIPRAVLLRAVGLIMLGLGLLEASGPARQGLRIDVTEALRLD